MIQFSDDEIFALEDALPIAIFGDKIPAYRIICYDKYKYVYDKDLLELFSKRGNVNFKKLLMPIKYLSSDDLSRSDLKDICDVMFRVLIDDIPMFIGAYPDIATWRLRIGK